jgi:2-oxoglutarate ferredoxin oxidoreductase subunit alpha
VKLLLGNEALALGSIQGGATFFAGFPTPVTSEIDRCMFRALPPGGGKAILAEDPAAAVSAVLGAGAGGGLGVTSLAANAIGSAEEMLRFGSESNLPALLFVVEGGADSPSHFECAGQAAAARLSFSPLSNPPPTVWAPASAPECFHLAERSAREARERRTPILLYVDRVLAHLREPVDLPTPRGRELAQNAAREEPPQSGSHHAADLYRSRDAAVILVAFGIVARAARTAVRLAREEGIRAGLFRPIRLWPFPHDDFDACGRARVVLVAELNEGQLWKEIAARSQSIPGREVRSLAEPREGRLGPARLLAAIREAAG